MDLRIQRSVVANLRNRPNPVDSGPFVLGLDLSTDSPHINYATPVPGIEITAGDVRGLVQAFGTLKPRLEYVVSCAPDLEKLLLDAGFEVESRNEYLICTPSTLTVPPVPEGFELFEPSTDEEFAGMISAQNESFGGEFSATPADVDRYRRNRAKGGLQVAARTLDGQYAGGGTAVAPDEGLSEVAGIAVRPQFRRRGLAGAVTAALTSRLFATGNDVAWLEASGDDSWRVYERVGFRPSGQRLYIAKD
ncbi:GNAT family N-acetyltransferase [Actinoplanes sp. NPDC020271]|uniref:GNAT family N-acetyltransferase n=1 Tax=Actinoplanes sp. NPDC020271 TaxID=3363896 RepID=UPI00378DDEC3